MSPAARAAAAARVTGHVYDHPSGPLDRFLVYLCSKCYRQMDREQQDGSWACPSKHVAGYKEVKALPFVAMIVRRATPEEVPK